MFLDFGMNAQNELVSIDETHRGLTDLTCPYCGERLIARKGQVLVHHFAHIGNTCRDVLEQRHHAYIPVYDKFNLGLSNNEVLYLEGIYRQLPESANYLNVVSPHNLEQWGFIKLNEYRTYWSRWGDQWDITTKGKIPFGGASLQRFAEIQQEVQLTRYRKLAEDVFSHVRLALPVQTVLGDFRIYRAQLRRIYAAKLYFLEIKHSDGTLYKIGITRRDIEARIEEIYRDLAPHLNQVKIKPLRLLQYRGSIEFYFKLRYQAQHTPIGNYTEYFTFENRRTVLADLTKLADYEPTGDIAAILGQTTTPLEADIHRIAEEAARQNALKQAAQT